MNTASKNSPKSKPKKLALRKWPVLLPAEMASRADAIAEQIASRLIDGDLLSENLIKLRTASIEELPTLWDTCGLMQGLAGLAAMCNQLERCRPDEDWLRIGSHFLKLASEDFREKPAKYGNSLCSGGAGIAYAILQSPRPPKKLQNIVEQINLSIKEEVDAYTQILNEDGGIKTGHFDALYGLSGTGRYLLAASADPLAKDLLEATLISFVGRAKHWPDNFRIGFHTPYNLMSPMEQKYNSCGNMNCGLAHGVPGPLAFMSCAASGGAQVEGLHNAIEFLADWLIQQKSMDKWGINWPNRVALGDTDKEADEATNARTAWCYGSPGIARSLYLAGQALDNEQFKSVAIEAMEAVYKRPRNAQMIDSATFCHGSAGLLQITLRFAADTELPIFVENARILSEDLINQFDLNKYWGYQDVVLGDTRMDQPGILNGAAGIVLTLLSAAHPVEPIWDQFFLLS